MVHARVLCELYHKCVLQVMHAANFWVSSQKSAQVACYRPTMWFMKESCSQIRAAPALPTQYHHSVCQGGWTLAARADRRVERPVRVPAICRPAASPSHRACASIELDHKDPIYLEGAKVSWSLRQLLAHNVLILGSSCRASLSHALAKRSGGRED